MSRIQKTRDKLETLGDDPEAALAIMMAISELMDEFHVASGKLNVAFGIDTVARLAQSHARVQAA